MAAECLSTLTEQWIRDRLKLKHQCLGYVRSLSLPGTYEEKIRHLGAGLTNFVCLKSLDLSCNALVSLEGVQHLKLLERLVLYNNCIPSLDEVDVLFELPPLRELDLRLNPLTKDYPHYRPYVVHAMLSLRKLDGCSVRTSERNAAMMQFSSDYLPQRKSLSLDCVTNQRSSNRRLALVQSLTKRLSHMTDSNESREESLEDTTRQQSSTPGREKAKSILRQYSTKRGSPDVKLQHSVEQTNAKNSTKVNSKPKVSFGTYVEKHSPATEPPRREGRGYFTPHPGCKSAPPFNIRPSSPQGLYRSDGANPVLHPSRLTSFDFKKQKSASTPEADNKKRGRYRKPLEMLLNLLDKYWSSPRSLHHNNNFLSQCVNILSLMETDLSSREVEVKALKQEVSLLKCQGAAQEEKLKSEIWNLSNQLEESRSAMVKLNKQLNVVTEENDTLQKRLVKMERHYLKFMMKSSPLCQIKEAQTEVKELRREIEGLREKVTDSSSVLHGNHRFLAGE